MTRAISSNHDKTVGYVLLASGIALLFLPRLGIAGRSDSNFIVGSSWIAAALLLLTATLAACPSPKLIRGGAALLFVLGFIGPFVANFIDQSFGA